MRLKTVDELFGGLKVRNIHKEVGLGIRRLREAKGWSQAELGVKSRVHCSHMGAVERGEVNVTLDTLQKLASALDAPVGEFFRKNDSNAKEKRKSK